MASEFFLRLDPDWLGHWKLRRVSARFGATGALAVLRLWSEAARTWQDGCLPNIPLDELGRLIEAPGDDPAIFIEFLVDARLLDRSDAGGALVIHNWPSRQPYIVHAQARAEQNRKNIQIRWDKERALAAASPSRRNFTVAPTPKASEPKRPRATQWPADFALDEELTQFAATRGLDAKDEFAQFRDHCLGKAKTYVDWRAGFREWCQRSVTFGGARRSTNGASKMSVIEVQKARVAELAAQAKR